MENPLAILSTDELRQRRSAKWRWYEPDVLPLFVAEMDTPLAEPIRKALAEAVARGDTGYPHAGRLPEAFASFAFRRYGWWPDPSRMVVVSDVVHGIAEVLNNVSEPGAGVVVNTPAYPPFFAVVAQSGRRIVPSPLRPLPGGGHTLDLDRLDHDLTQPGVQVYLVCNPHNPTGMVLGRDELGAIADLAQRRGVRLLVDEIHAPLTYPGVTHTPIGVLPAEAAQSAIVFVSASKAWNLPGLKAALVIAAGSAGWPALSPLLADPAMIGTGLLGVIAGEIALTECEAWLDALISGLDANRRMLAELLTSHLPEVGYHPPEATYLAWLDVSRLGLGDDPAAVLLEKGRVAVTPGHHFGDPGHGHVRLNFATSPDRLAEGVRRMASVVRPD